jgi:phosphatidylinositol-4-phosphate 3-kinase
MPQLIEALKYERNHESALIALMLNYSYKSIRFAHSLYWHLKEHISRSYDCILLRYLMVSDALVHFFNKAMIDEIKQEVLLVNMIDKIGVNIKKNKSIDLFFEELDNLNREWPLKKSNQETSCRLPYNISHCSKEIDTKLCSIITSYTMPLKLVFKNIDPTANSFYTIYKIGDDLRQDMFVLQLINVMNELWLSEDIDLHLLTFTCLQTDYKRGFIQMITNAETLKEIQKGDVINAFKKNCINDWLKTHNPNNFKRAIENFTKSCAAYSLATYILGIGDRHNDNIMVKYTGHMFHIDFGKYLGDVQTFAGIKRDRTPILFTSDMFYVICQSKEPNEKFQDFIELCCKAFQILRKNYNHLLTLIDLMINSNIPGLNRNAIQFVYKNLMIEMNDDEASNSLKKYLVFFLPNF